MLGGRRVDLGDRRGYLRLALKHDLPIIPVVATGIDATYVGLNDGYGLSKALFGRGDLPAWLALGAGGIWPLALPFPVKLRQRIGAPIRLGPRGRCRRPRTRARAGHGDAAVDARRAVRRCRSPPPSASSSGPAPTARPATSACSTAPATPGRTGRGSATANARPRRERGCRRRGFSAATTSCCSSSRSTSRSSCCWAPGRSAPCRSSSACPTGSPTRGVSCRAAPHRAAPPARTLVVSDAFVPCAGESGAAHRRRRGCCERARSEWGPARSGSPALIQLTSGSTGQPRGVVLSHALVSSTSPRSARRCPRASTHARSRGCRCTTTWASSAACCTRSSTALR